MQVIRLYKNSADTASGAVSTKPRKCCTTEKKGRVVLKPGMIFTVEPMINQGKRHLRILNDGWTVVTKDRSLSAQWEHEVLVTETGYEILAVSPATGKP